MILLGIITSWPWSVSGENFFDLHEKFEDLYEDARLKIDEIAERLLTLRLRPLSTTSAYLESAKIEEAGKVLDSHKMVKIILENHKILIADMRTIISRASEVDDEGTIEMISGFLSEIEKKSWMLDAWKTKKLEVAKV